MLSSGDPIHRIVACLSGILKNDSIDYLFVRCHIVNSNICFILIFEIGTLGYVMSEVEGGKPFSQVVKGAKSLGYTEPGMIIALR